MNVHSVAGFLSTCSIAVTARQIGHQFRPEFTRLVAELPGFAKNLREQAQRAQITLATEPQPEYTDPYDGRDATAIDRDAIEPRRGSDSRDPPDGAGTEAVRRASSAALGC